jgi:methionyl-tRNA synthetase
MNTCLVTTSIPYVNARPHVGFALELVQADVIARWHRLLGDRVYFVSGTDENAIKNVVVAKEQGLTPRQLCDRNASAYETLIEKLSISTDAFIRTSSDAHHRGARKFWHACSGDIEKERYTGRYCIGCEDFYLEKDLIDGNCPTHHQPTELIEEENYFFRLSRHQTAIRSALDTEYRIRPDTRRNEASAFLDRGLKDFSISRSIDRSDGWGVRVPDDETQTLYVWFDALTNYLNAIGFENDPGQFKAFWENADRIIHVIGKDVLKFHALYWPGMLTSAGLRLPTDLHVHGFLTVDGQKISKSLGNVVDPIPIVERFGSDALRYYLLRYVPTVSDSDFSHRHFAEAYESDLANTLGNLVSRLEVLFEKSGLESIRADEVERIPPEGLEERRFHLTLETLWETVRDINRDIESKRPWEYLQGGDTVQLHHDLTRWILVLVQFAYQIEPFLPLTSKEIERRFTADKISRGEPLFPRIGLQPQSPHRAEPRWGDR